MNTPPCRVIVIMIASSLRMGHLDWMLYLG